MISNRLTEFLGIDHPIILAPMAFAAGGELAAAVSRAGGLGLIGGAYGDAEWLSEQFELANDQHVGVGFISWSLENNPDLLDMALERNPKAVCLSFGDPAPFIDTIRSAGVPIICQVQTLRDAAHAVDLGVDVVVAQGAEAGGHGEKRATMTLVPEVADLIAERSAKTLLCAAGGVADGRGLAAAMMLGADGVLIGSRFWATNEALVHPNMHAAAKLATGDQTIRSSVMDIARGLDWPERYTARVLKNPFTDKWHDNLSELRRNADEESARWRKAWLSGDVSVANTFVGEVTGLIAEVTTAGDIVNSTVKQAEDLLQRYRPGQ